MTDFSIGPALAGGFMIGAAALLLGHGAGRVAGISGILDGLLAPGADDRGWRLAFLLGLPLGALGVWSAGLGERPSIEASTGLLVAAGLIVGFGTRLGSGCTSGHGVCGVARGSKRSIVATATFMATGALTVWVLRHGGGL